MHRRRPLLVSPSQPHCKSLKLRGVETLPPLSNLASLATLDIIRCGGDARGVGMRRLLAHGCLQKLTVRKSINFFNSDEQEHELSSIPPSSGSTLQLFLWTDDVAGVFAAPICRLLSSSLTELELSVNTEVEGFTVQQAEALQLLTSLQLLRFIDFEKLQSLPAGLHRLTSLKTLQIWQCPSIRLLPTKDGLPNSLQNLSIYDCSAIRSLPKDGLPNSLQNLIIFACPAIRSLPKDGLPSSLQNLSICHCPAIRSLPKDSLPDSLQELHISDCPSIRALPNGGLPTSLRLIDVSDSDNEDLKRQCRSLVGSIPIVRA